MSLVSDALNNYRRQDVAKDDILEALAAAVTAIAGLNALVSLPDPPEFDDRILPMQMLYRPLNVGYKFKINLKNP
jgi:predicted RNase H-like nuclease